MSASCRLLYLSLLLPIVISAKEKFSVYRLLPNNTQQFNYIQDLYANATRLDLNFWKKSDEMSGYWDVMVENERHLNILNGIKDEDIQFIKTINDVEELIRSREKRGRSRRLRDESGSPVYDFNNYGSYTQMTSWMRALARKHSKFVQFISIGTTHEGRSIDGLEIGKHSNSETI